MPPIHAGDGGGEAVPLLRLTVPQSAAEMPGSAVVSAKDRRAALVWGLLAATMIAAGAFSIHGGGATAADAGSTPLAGQLGAAWSHSIEFTVNCGGYRKMKLGCVAAVELGATDFGDSNVMVAVKYYVTAYDDSSFTPLWTAMQSMNRSSEHTLQAGEIDLYRLRPGTRYHAELYLAANAGSRPSVVKKAIFDVPETGYAAFDNGPLGEVMHGSAFSFGVMTTDYEVSEDGSVLFQGIISLDTSGYVVWYHDFGYKMSAFDQTSSYSLVAIVFPEDGDLVIHSNGTSNRVTSRLVEVTPAGYARENQQNNTCSGTAAHWSTITHECRVDRASDRVLTIRQKLLPISADDDARGAIKYEGARADYYLGDEIYEWHTEHNELKLLYRLSDYLNPWMVNVTQPNSFTWGTYYCSAPKQSEVTALDWSHASGVTVGTNGDYLLALRNLDAILCFAADGSGLRWTLSATLPSDFHFPSRSDRFYDPHVPIAVDDTHILLIDNGNNRPNCTKASSKCYSRAVEVELDFTTSPWTSRVVWEFSFPLQQSSGKGALAAMEAADLWELDGGNVIPIDANHTVVAFTGTELADDDVFRNASLIFELERGLRDDAAGNSMRGAMTLKRPAWKSGAYRAVPFPSLYGETTASPFSGGNQGGDAPPAAVAGAIERR